MWKKTCHDGISSLFFFFRNETVRNVLTDFVTCVRVQSLRGANDCSVEDILDIIKKDRYHLGIINQEENIDSCITGKKLYSCQAFVYWIYNKNDMIHWIHLIFQFTSKHSIFINHYPAGTESH